MIRKLPLIATLAALLAGALIAQETVTIPEGAAKYHSALVKRPNGGYLFDRFYNAWLDTGTLDGLKSFLQSKADAPAATTGDRLLLAYFHAKQNQDAEALQVFEKALAADQGNAEAWFELAKIHARLLDFEKAIASLTKADAANPKEDLAAEMGQFKGRTLMRAGKIEEGLKACQDLLAAQPGDEELQEDLIELLLAEGLLDQAIAASQKLIEQTPDPYQKVTRRMRLGDIYQRSGRREEALKTYGVNLAASGQNSWMEKEVLTQLERVFRREDDLAGWKKYLTEQAAAQPQRVALQERLATVQAELNETDGAIATYTNILKLTPGDRLRREAFIQLLARLKKHPEAVEQMRALRALFPDDADMLAQLAIQEQAAGQKDAAKASVLAYLEKSNHSEYAHLRAGQLLEEFKDPGAAEIYTKLVAAFPESIGAQEAQAAYLHRAGKKEEAIAIWKALAAKGTGQDALRAAQALAGRGEKQDAYDILQARAAEFTNDFVFLGQLCTAAIAADRHQDAAPWAEQRVRLATNPTDLMDAIRQAATVFAKAENPDAFLTKLREKKDRTATESCLLAELLEQNTDYEGAEAVLRPSIEAGDPLGISQLVRLLETRGQLDAAAAAMVKLTQLPGNNNSTNLQRLVTLQRRAMKFEDALRTVESWRQVVPGAAAPWREEASILADSGKMEEAVAVLRRAAQRFEGQEDIRVQLAQFYSMLGKYSEAERIYWTLYEAAEDPSAKLSWVTHLAQAARGRGLTRELIEQFEERRRNNRTSLDPLLAMAEVYKQEGNYEERRKVLVDATRLRPEDVTILHEVARIEEEEGEWQRALQTLELASRLDQTDGTRRRIARVHLTWGDPEEGFRLVRELVGGDQMDAAGALTLADALIVNGGWERVVEFVTPQTERFPDDYRLAYLRAVALEESYQEPAARALFMRLITWKTEMARPLPASTNPLAQMTSMMSNMYGPMPDGTMDLIMMMQNSMQAYYHQQILRQPGMRMSGNPYQTTSGLTRTVMMPTSLQDLRSYSLAHLRTLSQTLTPEEIKELAATLKRDGVESAEIALRFAAEQIYAGRMQTIPEDLLQDYPDHLGIQALSVLMGMNVLQGDRSQANLARLTHSYEVLKSGYPELAFMAALVAAGSGIDAEEEGKALLDRAFKELPKLESPSGMMRYTLPMAMGIQNQPRQSALPVRFRKQLIDLMLAWRAADLKNPARLASTINILGPVEPVGLILRGEEDPTAFLNYLQEEIANHKPGPQGISLTQTLSMYLGGFGQAGQLLTPLGFPPAEIPDFPPAVLMQFMEMPNFFYGGTAPLDPAKLAAKLDLVKDPILKTIVAYRAEKPEVAKAQVEQWLSAPKESRPGVRELIMAAGFLGKEGEPARAVTILEEVRQRPLSKNLRQRVDGAMVSYVVELGEKAEPTVKELGRQALLRLRYGVSNSIQRQEVATAMTALGLEKEAEQLTALASTTSPSSSSNMYGPGPASPPLGTDLDRIRKFATSGEEPKAIELTLKILERGTRAMAAPNAYQTNVDYELINFIRNVRGILSLEKIAAAMGEPGTSLAQRVEHATLLDLLGRRKEAIPILEEALKEGGRNYDGMRMRLAFLKAAESPAAGAAYLATLEGADFSQAGNQMNLIIQMEQYSDDRQDFYLKFVEMTVLWLEKLEAAQAETLRTEWVKETVLNYAQQSMNVGDEYLPRLMLETPQPDTDGARQRRALHDRLCLAMQKVPLLAREGFENWAALAVREAKDEADWARLDEAARAALVQIGRQKKSLHPVNQSYSYSTSPGERTLMTWPPDEYLIWRAFTRGGPGGRAEAEKVIEDSSAWPREEQLAAKAFFNLYFAPADEFEASADAFLRSSQVSMNRPYPVADSQASKVYTAWKARKEELGDIFANFALERTRRDRQQQIQISTLVDDYVREEAAKGWDAGLAAMEKVTVIWLGKREKWGEFTKAVSAQGGHHYYGNYQNQAHQIFAMFLGRVSWDDKLVFLVTDFLAENGLDAPAIVRQGIYSFLSNGELVRNPARVVSLIEAGPLREPNSFRTFPMGQRGSSEESALKRLLDYLKRNEPATVQVKEKFLADLAGRKEFTAGLILAYLQPDYFTPVMEFLGSHRAEVEKFSAREKKELMDFALPVISRAAIPTLSADALAVRQHLLESSAREHLGKAGEFLASTAMSPEIQNNNYEFYNEVIPIIHALIDSKDTDKAIAVYWHAVDLIAKKQKEGNWERGQDGWTAPAQLFAEVMRRDSGRNGIPRLGFYLKLLGKDAGTERLAINDCYIYSLLIAAFNQEGGEKDMPKALAALCAGLHREVGAGSVTLLAPDILAWINRFTETQRIELVRWADRHSQGQPWSGIAREMALAGRLSLASGTATMREKALKEFPDLDAWRAPYLAYVSNEEQGLMARLYFAAALTERTTTPVEPEFARRAADVTARALNGGHYFEGQHMLYLLAPFTALERDAAWEATAQSLLKGWTYVNRFNKANARTGQAYTPSLNTTLAMLAVQAKLGADLPIHAGSFAWNGAEMRALWTCVNHGNHALARQFLEKGWPAASLDEIRSNTGRFGLTYSETFQNKMAAFLATVEDPGLRLLAEAALSSLNDPRPENKEAAGKFEPRSRRLTFISRRFDEVTFTNPAMAKKVLAFFASDESASQAVAKHLAVEFASFSGQAVVLLNDRQKSLEAIRIPLSHALIEARAGRGEALKKVVTEIAQAQTGHDRYNRHQVLESIGVRITDRVRRFGGHVEKAEAAVLAEGLRTVIGGMDPNYGIGFHFLLAHKILSVTGEVEQKTWLAGLPEVLRKRIASICKDEGDRSFWTTSTQMLQAASPKPAVLERRLAVMLDVLADPAFQGAFAGYPAEVFQRTENAKLLLPEEILAHGDALAAAFPRKGWAAVELAEGHQKAGHAEAAQKWADEALKLGSADAEIKTRVDAVLKALAPK